MSEWKKKSENCWALCISLHPVSREEVTHFTVNSSTPISKVIMSMKQRYGLKTARLMADGEIITEENVPMIYLEGCCLVLEPLS